ncbi:hypothetical protein DY000_02032143 [Brassica cretica]|uniref:DUF630 domain-containing protein n=1 Tax=Brassica cretica TaxID=69181 RepID=A0ABQ7DJ44_BRACR|nr:hypothetical protein DY000_02032143 [Brassica cretica]
MGCAASKLDSEDTVRRCKDRRRLMKEAVYARHHLAAAHADYCRSLRVTGSALSSFAGGEPLSVPDQTPQQSPANRIPPSAAPAPLLKLKQAPPITSNRRRKQQHKPKVPHILSDSSPWSSPMSQRSNFYQNSTYSATPSHASSVWNWENFYPPSPPDSEFFDKKAQERRQKPDNNPFRSEYDFFHSSKKNKNQFESDEEAEETEREEAHCSEWDVHDHYSSTSSSEEEEDDHMESISEVGTYPMSRHHHQEPSSPMPQERRYHDKADDDASYRGGGEMEMVVRHRNLKEIADSLKENFDKAAAAGDQVSQMLELGRAQLDRSFGQLKSEFILLFL